MRVFDQWGKGGLEWNRTPENIPLLFCFIILPAFANTV
jgi:hypothetical protein